MKKSRVPVGCMRKHHARSAGWSIPFLACAAIACGGAGTEAGLCTEAGCSCTQDSGCGTTSLGEKLTCQGGVCAAQSCQPGRTGCPCGSGCAVEGDECADGICRPLNCAAGALGCPCDAGICGPDLVCQDGRTCVDGSGLPGGPCLSDGRCTGAASCQGGLCVSCSIGSDGCACREGGKCNFGLGCGNGICMDKSLVPEVPAQPKCYTPCSADLVEDGVVRPCDSTGLLEGCLDGTECNAGSCTPIGESRPTCEKDSNCPSFQICLEGNCYSNCVLDEDCPSSLKCHRKVCRLPCQSSAEGDAGTCPAGQSCITRDGLFGVCLSPSTPGSLVQERVLGNFQVSRSRVELSNVSTSWTLTITNDDPAQQKFTVRKRSHDATLPDGSRMQADVKADQEVKCESLECPLYWLKLGGEQVEETTVTADGGGGQVSIEISAAGDGPAPRWDGIIEVVHVRYGTRTISMSYSETPSGRWSGTMYYFATFRDQYLDDWRKNRDDSALLGKVENAFIAKWGAFRKGDLAWDEFLAIVESTRIESWRLPNVVKNCPTAACYPSMLNAEGVEGYSTDLQSRPIPSGVVDLPFAMDLRHPVPADPLQMEGRIASEKALQYPGNPAVKLRFRDSPSACRTQGGACVAFVDSMQATSFVGGRYATVAGDDGCARATDFSAVPTPWLVPGFERGVETDAETNLKYRYECRDRRMPFAPPAGATGSEESVALNQGLAAANPIPDGRARLRTLEVVDGALVNQSTLFLIVRESYAGIGSGDLGASPAVFAAYAVVLLQRVPADLDADAFQGSTPVDSRSEPDDILDVQCDPFLVSAVLKGKALDETTAAAMLDAMIDGTASVSGVAEIGELSAEAVHYVCIHATGSWFDRGRDGESVCPVGSEVIFFTVKKTDMNQEAFNGHACQKDKTCWATLKDWQAKNDAVLEQYQPIWRCSSEDKVTVFCDPDDRLDMTEGKIFYEHTPAETFFGPLGVAVNDAFRYKTHFRNRTSGQGVGFTPQACIPGSSQVPYCYSAPDIEAVRQRVDCVLYLWKNHYDDIRLDEAHPEARKKLDEYLCTDFAYAEACVPGMDASAEIPHDGFERLYAELLVMMGDESFTRAASARFDIAGTLGGSFEGSLFEPGGINLSGAAGFEMKKLYQAHQYYQEALDRFYSMNTHLWLALKAEGSRNFVTQATVTWYLERLTRASTGKARTANEIARRYAGFNRPDLARVVIERSYVATYLESVLFSRFLLEVTDRVASNDRSQVTAVLEAGQGEYQMALLGMRTEYGKITDNVTYFGFQPDYIPFPAVNSMEDNAFEAVRSRARQKLEVARAREEAALAKNYAFESDAQEFQAELVRLSINYDAQLADYCGALEGEDGRLYPAIKRYAYLNSNSKVQDPCGMMGTGRIWEAIAALDVVRLDFLKAQRQAENLEDEVALEKKRVQDQCAQGAVAATYVYDAGAKKKTLEGDIADLRQAIGMMDRAAGQAATLAGLQACVAGTSDSCTNSLAAMGSYAIVAAGLDSGIWVEEDKVESKEAEILQIDLETAKWQTTNECAVARIDSKARTDTLLLTVKTLELDVLRATYGIQMALSEVRQMLETARRLEQELADSEQLSINVAAAHNDANVRIYRNDAVVNAEIAFDDALREAYKLTKLYEYYTSRSYAELPKLFLIRMVQYGEYNLENYIFDLENAYWEFEDVYGLPDTRVAQLSLLDDIFRIPYLRENGTPLGDDERKQLMRDRLADPGLLDENAYLRIPFITGFEDLSPLTRNHKVLHVEACIWGSGSGDAVARLYLRQSGTSMVRGLSGDTAYYRFPERTAVLNPFFSDVKKFVDADIYRNYKLAGRPYVNTAWDLVINQRDEKANQDLDLQKLDDIILYVYYTDFTAF